jgi:hypothetical protein
LLRSSGDSFVFYEASGTLSATVPGAGTIRVSPGYAMVGGILYSNDSNVDLSIIANNSIYPRMDRVIIRIDWTAQTARLAIKTGRPAILPEPPAMTQMVGELYEMPLFRYFLAAGATTVAGATDTSLLDERVFAHTADRENLYINENCAPNSEFMSSEASGALATATTQTPAMWEFSNTPTVDVVSKFDDMVRGSCMEATVTSTNYVFLDWTFVPSTTPVITISMYVEVLSGTLTIGNGATTLKLVDVTNGPVPVVIRLTGTTTFSLRLSSSGTCQFRLGQFTLTHGLLSAPFGAVHETVVYGNRKIRLLDTGGTFTETIDNPKGTVGLIARLFAKDTLSSTNSTCYMAVRDTLGNCDQLRIELGRHPNSYEMYGSGIIGLVPSSLSDPDATLQVNVTSAAVGTMESFLNELGTIT